MKKSQLLGTLCAALCTLTTLSAQAVTVPAGLNPGDTYQLVFVTAGTIDATSTDIADYNSFVQAQAALNPSLTGTDLGITYAAIGSTSTVNANSNALVAGPVYLVDGSALIATSFSDFWDGTIGSPIRIDQNGATKSAITIDTIRVWTGSFSSGLKASPLGQAGGVTAGGNTVANSSWIASTDLSGVTTPYAMYALSSVITVSAVPVPAAVWLFGSGLLGLVGVARRKARA